MSRPAKIIASFLLPAALLVVAFFYSGIDDGTRSAIAIAIPWFFLIERKGYPTIGNLLLVAALVVWFLVPGRTEAFLLAAAPLVLPAIFLPARKEGKEIWVLSPGGLGAFEFRFGKDPE